MNLVDAIRLELNLLQPKICNLKCTDLVTLKIPFIFIISPSDGKALESEFKRRSPGDLHRPLVAFEELYRPQKNVGFKSNTVIEDSIELKFYSCILKVCCE